MTVYGTLKSDLGEGGDTVVLWRKKRLLKRLETRPPEEWFPHFDKSIKLYNKALRLEKAGKTDRAIKLYLKNIRKYKPPGLAHFERPAILLERQGHYKEAIKVCDMALRVKVVPEATAEAFQREFSARKRRLQGLKVRRKRK
jgi:tetratricopeptide (TPR) repeat protein